MWQSSLPTALVKVGIMPRESGVSHDFLVSLTPDPSRRVLVHDVRSILETTRIRDRMSKHLGIIVTKVWEVNLLPPASARTSGD